MLAIVRVKMRNGNNDLWNYIVENDNTIESEFNGEAKLMYITRRARHEDTSLFIRAKNPDVLGNFVANNIATIEGADKIWMINLMGMKFFKIPEKLLDEWQRSVVTVRAYPSKYSDIYNSISNLAPNSDVAPVYLAYTFHLYGDSLMFSLVSKDVNSAQKFIEDNIKNLPGVFGHTTTVIEKQQRLAGKDDWKEYVRANLLQA
jgi:DNA-binding Lrp family transcriptional regulator